MAVAGLLVLLLLHRYEDARARAVAVDGASLASGVPCLAVEGLDLGHRYVGRQVDGHGDGVVHPLLHAALHGHFLVPVDVVGRSAGVGRAGHDVVEFFLGVVLLGVDAGHLHPVKELGMVDDVLLELVAGVVGVVHTCVDLGGVDLAAALVDGHEHRLDARRSAGHEACRACGGDGETGDVAASEAAHVGVELRVSGRQTCDEGIGGLAFGVVHLEGSALACHLD